ncbi:MAG TPA: pullulanase-type alpha-1,6-glucosidase [Steroidobacteraceae bacterium]|jgi:pullulanase-type alpha-1,6-glucosidase|nr:pullulanase-type alpha-1,6-glucosidase [Steroidobacteraceae bacterium]
MSSKCLRARAIMPLALAILASCALTVSAQTIPASVGVPGSYQSEAGCGGDWDPACAATQLVYDANGDIWRNTFSIAPAGAFEYKVALNGTWDVNYGLHAEQNGANIPLATTSSPQNVTFYYDHKTHWITNNVSSIIATVPGDFQSEIGCGGDWDPACFRSWLQDINDTSIYSFSTSAIPAGTYEAKVALNGSWDVNYGQGGVQNGANIGFTVPANGMDVVFQWNSTTKELRIVVGGIHGDLTKAQAYWLSADTIAWNAPADATVTLFADPDGALTLDGPGIVTAANSRSWALIRDPAGLDAALKARFPHLANLAAFKLPADAVAAAAQSLKGQIAVGAARPGQGVDATGLQIPGVLDDLYSAKAAPVTLGPSFKQGQTTLRVWAPTARKLALRVFADASPATAFTTYPMTLDAASGIWSFTAPTSSLMGKYYLYEALVFVRSTNKVETNVVTDPYSVSLARNSTRSQVVSLEDPQLQPRGWRTLGKPWLAAPEDIVLYELHVRDFSATDSTVPASLRGTYAAFAQKRSDGMKHLATLALAGVTHVHLLPSFDIASVNEDKSTWIATPFDTLSALPADSPEQQALTQAIADRDGFNWGYDPLHYNVPEGSYATDADGSRRILEFRQMVQSLSQSGLRVVMDVVYNHTTSAGQNPNSILDKLVPGYYHRLNGDGVVLNESCCADTATEHAMMEKLMVDSVVQWARQYKVDGFRFDIMGFHLKSNLLKVRAALDALTLAKDGVDGRSVYLYGEGWNFGVMANNGRGVNAIQVNMAGTGIGSFSDRIRDAVRGGGPFSPRRDQGFATGLFTEPNGTFGGSAADEKAALLRLTDFVRLGLAGNIASYSIVDASGATKTGHEVDYFGMPGAYGEKPSDTIQYIGVHDDPDWFDTLNLKLSSSVPRADRVRMARLGMDIVALSQGVPFFMAGDDILRSKSADRNSYNSGDWFNRIDWTMKSNNWGVGLPPANGNQDDWSIIGPALADPNLKPGAKDIEGTYRHMLEMLVIRKTSGLFRLRTAEEIKKAVSFYNVGPAQIPGLIVERIANTGRSCFPVSEAVVLINASPQAQSFTGAAFKQRPLLLHPVQALSQDPVVRTSKFQRSTGTFTIPPRTTAVFIEPCFGVH